MKTNKMFLIFSMATSLLLFGCPYESKFPLSNSSESTIDTLLIGSWDEISAKDEEPATSIEINIFNDHEYLSQMMSRDKGSLTIQGFRAFETTINHQKILNIQEIGNKPKYNFYKYVVSSDTLKIASVLKDSIKIEFKNSTELNTYFSKNMNSPKFYEDVRVFIKRKRK